MAMVILRRALLLVLGIAAGVLALPGASLAVDLHPPGEYEVKAAFLYNFTKYVEWPVPAFRESGDSLVICVLGRDPFGSILDETLRGESVHAKKLAIRRLARVDEAAGCHVLFVSSSEERDVARILKAIEVTSVLTVGEVEGFAERGGIVNLRKEQNKVRFDINVEAAERSGLKISSQLLKLGKIVRSGAE